MTQKEMKSLIDRRKETFEQLLDQEYEQVKVNGEKCFRISSDRIITVTSLHSFNALTIEYADSLKEAVNNAYEDGDLFYMEDYEDDELFHAMLQEINQ